MRTSIPHGWKTTSTCKGPEAGMVSLRNKKMVVGRQGRVRGQETMKSAEARALSKQGEPQEGRGPRQTQKQTHIHLHPNTSADAPPFTQWGKKNLLCPVKTPKFTVAKFGLHTCHCLPPSFHTPFPSKEYERGHTYIHTQPRAPPSDGLFSPNTLFPLP